MPAAPYSAVAVAAGVGLAVVEAVGVAEPDVADDAAVTVVVVEAAVSVSVASRAPCPPPQRALWWGRWPFEYLDVARA